MSKSDLTVLEVSDSLTGFDEMAISQHFGCPVSELMETDASMWGRSLVFVLKRREGLSDDDARNAALSMTIKGVADYFPKESEESGKDEPPAADSPESSPPSAS